MTPEKKPISQPPAMSVEYKIKLPTRNQRRKKASPPRKRLRRIPHVTRLLALAYHMQDLVDKGVVNDYADIARLSGLSRARLSQIMNLCLLAPKIQEEILSYTADSASCIRERHLREVIKEQLWDRQYRVWKDLAAEKS